MSTQAWLWVGFGVFVCSMLALDLGVINRKAHEVKFKEAITWVCIWMSLAFIFNLGILYWSGKKLALEFLTGYLLEQSLSVDNMFVFLLIFEYFRVPSAYQHKVLFWGIIGALVFRLIFIFAGVAIIERAEWMLYVFGAFLVFSGLKMWKKSDEEIDPEKNPVLKVFKRFMPVAADYDKDHFFTVIGGKRAATPMLVVLIVVETTDILFALDSIPAVMAITQNRFIIFTSNVFAILGLRALFFALAGFMKIFHYLHYGLAAILVFIGIKMIIHHYIHIPVPVALGVLAGILTLSVVASIIWPAPEERHEAAPSTPEA